MPEEHIQGLIPHHHDLRAPCDVDTRVYNGADLSFPLQRIIIQYHIPSQSIVDRERNATKFIQPSRAKLRSGLCSFKLGTVVRTGCSIFLLYDDCQGMTYVLLGERKGKVRLGMRASTSQESCR